MPYIWLAVAIIYPILHLQHVLPDIPDANLYTNTMVLVAGSIVAALERK